MVYGVIPAAGLGRRMGSGAAKKTFLSLRGCPVITYTWTAFQEVQEVDRIICVVAEEDMPYCKALLERGQWAKVDLILAGGAQRQDSVFAALIWLEQSASQEDIVLIHDAVRPLVTRELVSRVIAWAQAHGNAVAALPVFDTLKRVTADGVLKESLSREGLWVMQTPQAFRFGPLIEAHRHARQEAFYGTDDTTLVSRLGNPVYCVEGLYENIKITTPADMAFAERFLTGCKSDIA